MTRGATWLRSLGLAGAAFLSVASPKPPDRVFPLWQTRASHGVELDCGGVEIWVAKSGKAGLGLVVMAPRACAAELRGAVLVIDGRELPGGPVATQLPGVRWYVPFPFAGDDAWNRGVRQAEVRLELFASGAARQVRVELVHHYPGPHDPPLPGGDIPIVLHSTTDAPGLADVETPADPSGPPVVAPLDPGETDLMLWAGPLVGAGYGADDGGFAAVDVSVEASLAVGWRGRSHDSHTLFDAIEHDALGLNLGWKALEHGKGEWRHASVYGELQLTHHELSFAGGWQVHVPSRAHGPQVTACGLALCLRGTHTFDGETSVLVAVALKWPWLARFETR